MIDAECLICHKNSTQIAYEQWGEYPASCANEDAQAYVGVMLHDIGWTMALMAHHAMMAHQLHGDDILKAYEGLGKPAQVIDLGGGYKTVAPYIATTKGWRDWLKVSRVNIK